MRAEYEYSKDEELEGLAEAEEAKMAEAETKADAKGGEAEARPKYDPEVDSALVSENAKPTAPEGVRVDAKAEPEPEPKSSELDATT